MIQAFVHSAELRWFFGGLAQREEMKRWFMRELPLEDTSDDGDDVTDAPEPLVKLEPTRSDKYLRIPGCDSAGLKQRQGKLELKALVAGPRPVALGGAAGRLDEWVKWSFEPSDEDLKRRFSRELEGGGQWREVEKKRYLQKYSFDDGAPLPINPDGRPEAGCNVELTELVVEGSPGPWLTLGFEAFGSPGAVVAVLDAAARAFLAARGSAPLPLRLTDSFSYPSWMAGLG